MRPWWSSRTARRCTTSSSARCAPAIHRAWSVSRPPGTRAPPIVRGWWRSRVCGRTIAHIEGGAFAWDALRERLVRERALGERVGDEWSYYGRWVRAIEVLVTARGLCRAAAVDARAHALAARRKGHDD